MSDVELGRVGRALLLGLVIGSALLGLAAGGCAHAPPQAPPLWEICRDACAARDAAAAAVVGSVDKTAKPACMCAAKPEST